jgi:predicted Zn-ribbon and HTH transcriptional regulator
VPDSEQRPYKDRIITSADSRDDAAQIMYGLHLRGVRSMQIENEDKIPLAPIPGTKPPRFLILIDSDSELQWKIAQESLESIWDAILDQHPRAVTPSGHCSFCGYDVARLPRPTTCPECGVNIDSIAARRAMRSRRI